LSAQAKYAGTDAGNALMGYGASNLIEEEAALIPDIVHSKAMRMLQGHKTNFLVKIGNTISRNHFYRTHRSDEYHKIVIDVYQGLKENRITQKQIDEMKREMTSELFSQMYECNFPKEDAIDTRGYSPLVTDKEYDLAKVADIQLFGKLRLGCDVAGEGSNYSTIVVRGDNGAKLIYREHNKDTMSFVGVILKYAADYGVVPKDIFIDKIGIGKGVFDRVQEQKGEIGGVNVGESPEDEEEFINLRAQAYWRLGNAVRSGFKIVGDFQDLLAIKYKIQSDKKIKIKSKDEMQKEGIESPDVADALMLTFTKKREFEEKPYKQAPYQPSSPLEGGEV